MFTGKTQMDFWHSRGCVYATQFTAINWKSLPNYASKKIVKIYLFYCIPGTTVSCHK